MRRTPLPSPLRPTDLHSTTDALAAIEAASDGFWEWWVDAGHGYLSPKWAWALGYAEGELDVRAWWDLLIPEDHDAAEAALQAHFTQGTPYDVILRYTRKDGSIAWMRSRGTLIRDSQGNPERMCGFHSDLSDLILAKHALLHSAAQGSALRTDLEARVVSRTAELQRSNQDLEQFAYIASHDLQEPVRTIGTYCSWLFEDMDTILKANSLEMTSDMITARKYIREATTRLRTLITDLLHFSRTGRSIERDEVDLQKCALQALQGLSVAIAEAGVRINIQDDPVIVYGDRTTLTQVFQNLVSNALKFKSTEVSISFKTRETDVLVRVSDNGIGAEPIYLEKVFEPFTRLHTRDEYPGSGIGLALCLRIVRAHDGSIRALSEGEGRGFAVEFTIPLWRTEDEKSVAG